MRSDVTIQFVLAGEEDRAWLSDLRREAYRSLVLRTFGNFDERRHQRHCDETWSRGNVRLVLAGGDRCGMLQTEQRTSTLQIHEIQLLPRAQKQGLGTRLLEEVKEQARRSDLAVTLDVAHLNHEARRLYERLGFVRTGISPTHYLMRWKPR